MGRCRIVPLGSLRALRIGIQHGRRLVQGAGLAGRDAALFRSTVMCTAPGQCQRQSQSLKEAGNPYCPHRDDLSWVLSLLFDVLLKIHYIDP